MSYLEREPIRLRFIKESLKQYHLIKKNKYIDRKKRCHQEEDIYNCNCIPETKASHPNQSINCGEKCINKLISTECDPDSCPCGDLCQNRKFQKHENAAAYPCNY